GIATTFKPDPRGWSEPYSPALDAGPLDEVVVWVAMDFKLRRQDKVVATLMVLSVESIKSGKRSPDYWQAEAAWMNGDTDVVLQQSRTRGKPATSA
ncbi:MAG: hypothetical protein ACK6DF_02005, partial [Betaproteobacteria bacterium]